MKSTVYITTPIYYVTARPHLGSLYSTLLADVAARWHKLQGKKVFFLTGTDEHGQKIAQAADKAGQKPQEFVDSVIPAYQELWGKYHISYDHFIRTTDFHHIKAVQQWISLLLKQGDIYKSFYEGWYCTPCETYVVEASQHQTGDAPPCPSCNRPTHRVSEESYFFKLSAYQDRLLKFFQAQPEFIVPRERAQEVINFVKAGLKDLSISRTTVTWGIPFPGDPKHVVYVWADALNNYITAIGWGDAAKKEQFYTWWPADVQVMGKDIVRFHAVYWPAFLMAAGLAMPRRLLVHGWIKVGEQKMSKSLGNVVDPLALYDAYGADAVRYYLVRYLAITHDGEFGIADLEQKIGTDLANDLGNLLNRMIALADKNNLYEVKSPAAWSSAAVTLRGQLWTALDEYQAAMNECMFHMALAAVWKFIAQVNAYFHAQEPWKLASSDRARFIEVIAATAHSLRAIALLVWPVMPSKMEALLAALGQKLESNRDSLEELKTDVWVRTFMIKKIDPLFIKPEPSVAEQPSVQESSPQSSLITINDFSKVELVVGTILSCDEVPKSEKLWQLKVDFGDKGTRSILAGVRQHIDVASLVNKQGIFVINLAPRLMMGLESQGMMLAAGDASGKARMLTVTDAVPNGTRVK